jgi:hypothetical protein
MKRVVVGILALLSIIAILLAGVGGCNSTPEPLPEPSTNEPEVSSPAPAEFVVTSLNVPSEVLNGENVTVTVTVENVGGSEGDYTAVLTLDGVSVGNKEVTVAPGCSETVTFSWTQDKAGIYEIGVEDLTSTLLVKKTAAIVVTFDPNPAPCIAPPQWEVTIAEVNGVGVQLQEITLTEYAGDSFVDQGIYEVASTLEGLLESGYLPPFDSVTFGGGFWDCEEITHAVFVVTGIDDLGNEIEGTGRVDISH